MTTLTPPTITTADIEKSIQRGHHLRSKALTSFLAHLYRSVTSLGADRDRLPIRDDRNCATPA